MNRFAVILSAVIVAIVVALAGFYLYLTGGTQSARQAQAPAAVGVVHVKSIYQADGVNMSRPMGIGADENGDFWVTLRDEQKVVAFDRTGAVKRVWGSRGLKQGQMLAPIGVDGDPKTGHVYVTDRSRLRLIAFDMDGRFLWERPVLNPISPVVASNGVAVTTFGPLAMLTDQGEVVREAGTRGHATGQFDHPRSAAALEDGSLIVADTNNTRVQRVRATGTTTATATWVAGAPPRYQDDPKTSFGLPTGVTTDSQGRTFVLDGFRHAIAVLDTATGKEIYRFEDLQGDGNGRFYLPSGIAYLGANTFAVADTYNDRIQIVRLLLPSENNLVSRNPWLWWLIPLALMPALLLFGRRRVYATVAALDSARASGELRLLAAVYKRIRVTPDAYELYEDVEEGGVRIAPYLQVVGEPGDPSSIDVRLYSAAHPSRAGRLLLPRVRVLVADEPQASTARAESLKPITIAEVRETYAVKGSARAQTT